MVDHVARLYKFKNFAPESPSHVLLAHANDLSNLWHERFGHLNYRYLQQLCTQEMVNGLPLVSFEDGVCQGCVLGKHHQDKFEKGKAW